jgi:hypothetical protein
VWGHWSDTGSSPEQQRAQLNSIASVSYKLAQELSR